MNANVKYITQIRSSDLKDIAAACNIIAGAGLKITKNAESVKIEIDQPTLATMIESYCQQKGVLHSETPDPRSMNLDLGA